jgi:Flp pilus assembly protein protease CpaA
MKSKTTLTLATIVLIMASLVHLFKMLNNWELIIGSYTIPNWISIIGIVVPAILAFHLIKIRREL